MNPTDYAWSTVEFITRKSPNQIKVIVDEAKYPFLDRDPLGYVIHLSTPRRLDDNLLSLYGLHFDNDANGRPALWRMFRASVQHLSLHALMTDLEIYEELLSKGNYSNAMFAISLSEDYGVRGLMKASWPGLVIDLAYANYLSRLCFRNISHETNLATQIATNLLSFSMVGKELFSLGKRIDDDIRSAHLALLDYAQSVSEMCQCIGKGNKNDRDNETVANSRVLTKLKLEVAHEIHTLFSSRNLRLPFVPSLPYTEHYGEGGSDLLFQDPIQGVSEEERSNTLKQAFEEVSISPAPSKLQEEERSLKSESGRMLEAWEYDVLAQSRLLETYRKIGETSHFESFGFPGHDLAEYVRVRTRLIGRIRRALDLLRIAKTSIDEVSPLEYGYVDIPLAIQVIASESNDSNVFIREEPEKRSESWAILIDSSKSLERSVCAVGDATVCLAELANGMLPASDSWACFSFNENFHIVKDFSESYSNDIRGRIGGIRTGIKTYLPDAIRLASLKLQATPTELKVLLVVSDGYPQGYEGIENELQSVIQKVSKTGISLIGLGIESSSISKYFKTNLVARDAYELMKNLVNVYYEIASTA